MDSMSTIWLVTNPLSLMEQESSETYIDDVDRWDGVVGWVGGGVREVVEGEGEEDVAS